MSDDATTPQIYLVTPPDADRDGFAKQLTACLEAVPVACVRLALATTDAATISRTADRLRGICHDHDVALVIEDHIRMVAKLGLDGVHLTDGSRSVASTRKELGDDAIIGTHCGASTHDGMTAGECGADYVTFGPLSDTGLGDGTLAKPDLFQWWSQMIELPVVAEGGLTPELIRTLAPVTDFFALGGEIWSAEDPAAALQELAAMMEPA